MNTKNPRFVQLTDPLGFDHYIEFFNGQVYGSENIAHVLTDKDARDEYQKALIELISKSEYGKFNGYAWRRIDPPGWLVA